MTRSLSNLYKQWFVQTDSEKTRVINSNAIIAERMDKPVLTAQNPQAKNREYVDGFAEGIVAENEGNVIKAEPEVDYVAQAKEEAERILAEAKKQAESVVTQAREEADSIEEAARSKGYQDGKEQLNQELDTLRGQLEESYRRKREELDDDYNDRRGHMEKDLVDVITTVFERVFHIQFADKKDILMHLIEDAILNIEDDKRFRVKVAETSVLFLEHHKEEILDRVGHDIELEILADSTMEGNDCIIETDSGVFNCSLGAQLENLIKDIRSLSS